MQETQDTQVQFLGWGGLLGGDMATHSSILAWKTPWTVAYHAPRPWDFPGKSTEVGCHFLLQRIFPTQELNPGLPHCRQMLYSLSHQGSLIQILINSGIICLFLLVILVILHCGFKLHFLDD